MVILWLFWCYFGVILGLFWVYFELYGCYMGLYKGYNIGIMEKNMETTKGHRGLLHSVEEPMPTPEARSAMNFEQPPDVKPLYYPYIR